MSYSLEIKQSVEKDLKKVPKEMVERIIEAIEKLSENPYPRQSKKIKSAERTYRLRVGDYRVIYQIDKERKVVVVYHVRHRKIAYENL